MCCENVVLFFFFFAISPDEHLTGVTKDGAICLNIYSTAVAQ